MNSWGRGVLFVGDSKRPFRGNPNSKMATLSASTDPRFQDPGTASTLSLPPPSEADFASSSFFFRRSPSLAPRQPSSYSSPSPSPLAMPAAATCELPQGSLLLREEESVGGGDDDENEKDDNEQPVDEESLSSSHSTLCPAPPPASSPLLDGPAAPLGCSLSSYEMKKNDRGELGFMAFHITHPHSANPDIGDGDTVPPEAALLSHETGRPMLCYRLSSLTSDAKSAGAAASDMEVASAVWSHPLLVEAAQSLFVTLCLHQAPRKAGAAAAAAAASFAMASSLDVLDSTGAKLVPTLVSAPSSSSTCCCSNRKDSAVINRRNVARAMVRALEKHRPSRPIPRYLALLLEEEEAGRGEMAVLGTDDPVRGEVEFAGLAGVIATRTGTVDHQKVVEVTYDSHRLSFGCVTRFALKRKVSGVVYHRTNDERMAAQVEIGRLGEVAETLPFAGTIQPDFDPKPALRKTPLRFVPLTGIQATRANRLVHQGRFDEAVHLLSPRQGLILMKTMHKSAQKSPHDVIDVPILPAWISVCHKQHHQEQLGAGCDGDEGDDPTCDFEHPPGYYEYNTYPSERLPPGYPWRGF